MCCWDCIPLLSVCYPRPWRQSEGAQISAYYEEEAKRSAIYTTTEPIVDSL